MRSAPSRRSAGRRCSPTRSIRGGRSRGGGRGPWRGLEIVSNDTAWHQRAASSARGQDRPRRAGAPLRRARAVLAISPTTPPTSSPASTPRRRRGARRGGAAPRAALLRRRARLPELPRGLRGLLDARPGGAHRRRRPPTPGRCSRRCSRGARPASSTASRPAAVSGWSGCGRAARSRSRSTRRPLEGAGAAPPRRAPGVARAVRGARRRGPRFRCDGGCAARRATGRRHRLRGGPGSSPTPSRSSRTTRGPPCTSSTPSRLLSSSSASRCCSTHPKLRHGFASGSASTGARLESGAGARASGSTARAPATCSRSADDAGAEGAPARLPASWSRRSPTAGSRWRGKKLGRGRRGGCTRPTISPAPPGARPRPLRPDLLVLEYTEIWPNLIRAARRPGAASR